MLAPKQGPKAEIGLRVLQPHARGRRGPSGLDEADHPNFKMQCEHHAAQRGEGWI